MPDRDSVIMALELCKYDPDPGQQDKYFHSCQHCPYWKDGIAPECAYMYTDAIALLKEQDKEIKALRLLVEWAEECDFGFDQFHDEYERYKDEIKDMGYIEGMIHVAKRTLEDHGAFEEGR